MTSQLAEIPLATQPPSGEPRPTAALRGLKKPSSRRSVLRGVAASALTVGALSLTWGNSGRAYAEENPSDSQWTGWDRNDCKDAYPEGYEEETDTSGEYKDAPGACFGGMISSEYCDANGWYRTDRVENYGTVTTYMPISGACGWEDNKNAWKWTTPDGNVYRCSDGEMTVTANGETNTVFSICRGKVS